MLPLKYVSHTNATNFSVTPPYAYREAAPQTPTSSTHEYMYWNIQKLCIKGSDRFLSFTSFSFFLINIPGQFFIPTTTSDDND